ncbi:1031_t:CDS:2 [Ambispora gerdemannii]|uniref:RBR-type E3 ubiquitin transferase n=1 Tax=Ambispora gerdemannii TaxID=144530 RepID=A0A9N8VY09_9GLOM|nr:1031_t:CDS:2 [Ambispora gerdemannii]
MSFSEIQILKTIYNNDFTHSNTFPLRYAINISGSAEGQQHENSIDNANNQIQILFDIPIKYPKQPINLRVINPLYDTNKKEIIDVKELQTQLEAHARELAEQEEFAMYEVAEFSRTWLWEHENNHQSIKTLRGEFWLGEWMDRTLDWRIESYSPARIMQVQFEAERKVVEKSDELIGIIVSITQARKYLRSNLWDIEKSVDALKNDYKEGKFQETARIIADEIENLNSMDNFNDNTAENSLKTCAICFDDYPKNETTVFAPCKHVVCNDCFIQYLTIKVSEKQVFEIYCPGESKCKVLVDPITIGWMLSNELTTKYHTWFRDSFIQLQQNSLNKKYLWCIDGKCNHAISHKISMNSSSNNNSNGLLHCNGCDSTWCQTCEKNGGHWPATCKDYQHYARNNHTVVIAVPKIAPVESLSTKPCPNCKIMVSKNGGCMHMICAFCQFNFCWGCGVDWNSRTHTAFYECDEPKFNVQTTYEVFEIDDIQKSPGQFQKNFKRGVIFYTAGIKSHTAKLNLLRKQPKNRKHEEPILQLQIKLNSLLVQVNYILKYTSMAFFARAEKITHAVRNAVEASQRVSIGLLALESLEGRVLEVDRLKLSQSGGNSAGGSKDCIPVQDKVLKLQQEFEKCNAQISSNVKRLFSSLKDKNNNPSNDDEIEWFHGNAEIETSALDDKDKKPLPSPETKEQLQQLMIDLEEIRALRNLDEKILSTKNRLDIGIVYSPEPETLSICICNMKREMSIPLREISAIKILPEPDKEIYIRLRFAKSYREIYKEVYKEENQDNFNHLAFFGSKRFRCKPFESIDSELVQNFVKRVQKVVHLTYVSMNRNPFDIAPGEVIHGEIGKGMYQEKESRRSVDYFFAREKKLMMEEKEKEDKLLEKPFNIDMNILCKFGIEIRAIKWPIEDSYHHLVYFIKQRFKRPVNKIYCKLTGDTNNNNSKSGGVVDINGCSCSWIPLYTEEEWKSVKEKVDTNNSVRILFYIK